MNCCALLFKVDLCYYICQPSIFFLQNAIILVFHSLSIHLLVEGGTFVIVYVLELLGIMLLLFAYMSFLVLVAFIFKVASHHVALAGPVLVR